MKTKNLLRGSMGILSLILAFAALLPAELRAAELEPSNVQSGDQFGCSVSPSGNISLVGAYIKDDLLGGAYVFRNLNTATGTVTESVELTTSDGAAMDSMGYVVSLSGSSGLINATWKDDGLGAAYLFRNLDTATGTITEDAKLTASDGVAGEYFAYSVSLSGTIGLAGAYYDNSYIGAAYVFRGLDTATGTITENAKLVAPDATSGDYLGNSVSISGTIGLAGAYGAGNSRGAAYVFRNLDTAEDTVTGDTKLFATDGVEGDFFGYSVSLSGNSALVGAHRENEKGDLAGAAYLFRNLNSATGLVGEVAKLTISDGQEDDFFGWSVALSGVTGLVGAYQDDSNRGGAYLFLGLDTATGSVTESVKISASDAFPQDRFGISVGLDGDTFVVGADGNSPGGRAYSGSVSSVTTLDADDAERTISGINFVSRGDWIIGKTTDNNSVTLTSGSTANVTTSGKKVYIGKDASSDSNMLVIDGSCTASEIRVGGADNSGNALIVDTNGIITGGSNVFVASGSYYGGGGLLQGNLTLAAGASLQFEPGGLQVHGSVTLDSTFGVDNILGLDDVSTDLPHLLIVSFATDFASLDLQNFGSANALAIGGGKKAYLSSPVEGTLLLTVLSLPPVITSAATKTGKVGTALTYQITASNTPTSFSATSLPAGLNYNMSTGKITGKPTKAGTFSAKVYASNAGGTGTKTVKFTIAKETTKPVLSITTPKSLAATVKTTSYTVKGKATDNISPVKVQYRIDPPGTAKYGSYKSIALSGTATSKTWSYKLATKTKGAWKVQFRALDAAGNISSVKTVTITRK